MVDEGYSNEKVQQISGASLSAVSRWKRQYKDELAGVTPKATGLTAEQREIQGLKKQLARAKQDNEILKKGCGFLHQGKSRVELIRQMKKANPNLQNQTTMRCV